MPFWNPLIGGKKILVIDYSNPTAGNLTLNPSGPGSLKTYVSPANATFVFAKEWYFSGGAVPDINGSLTFEQFGYLDYYVHASGEVRASFSGPFANTTNL